jgi:hypothetical protein
MKVKIGIIEKFIPQEYACGVDLITIDMLENTNKRLTKLERFLFAEASFRMTVLEEHPYVFEHIAGEIPQYVEIQNNRQGDYRYVVRYSDTKSMIVPNRVGRLCPDKREINFNFES